MQKHRILGVLLIALLAGCSDGTGPEPVNVSGEWAYSASNLVGSGVRCAVSTTGTLNQVGETFSGTHRNSYIECWRGTASYHYAGPTSGLIVNGRVDEDDIGFDVDTPSFHHSGKVTATQITGTATLGFSDGVVVTGTFYAVRR